jgi:hypothetical protein
LWSLPEANLTKIDALTFLGLPKSEFSSRGQNIYDRDAMRRDMYIFSGGQFQPRCEFAPHCYAPKTSNSVKSAFCDFQHAISLGARPFSTLNIKNLSKLQKKGRIYNYWPKMIIIFIICNLHYFAKSIIRMSFVLITKNPPEQDGKYVFVILCIFTTLSVLKSMSMVR